MLASLHHSSLAAQTLPTSYNVDDLNGQAHVINYSNYSRLNSLGQTVGLINPASPDPVLGHGLFVYTDTVGWEKVGEAPEPLGCVINAMFATDITDAGQIVGYVECLGEDMGVIAMIGFLYDGVAYQYMLPPAGRDYLALTSINESGTIAGYSYSFSDWRTLPVIVPSGGAPQLISTSPLLELAAYAWRINDAGSIVGTSEGGPFVYHNGTLTMIPVEGEGWDVNKHGHVVGLAWNATWSEHTPFIFRDGVVTMVPQAPGAMFGAFSGINDNGVIVGWNDFGGFVYSEESGYADLDALIDPLPGMTLVDRASSINNAGAIIADVLFGDNYGRLILTPSSTCDPESPVASFRNHSSAMLTAPRLKIIDPCDPWEFRIDATPAMSTVVARAQVTDVTPDPTSGLSFEWQAAFTYPTRQTTPVNLAKTFTQSNNGGMMPITMFFDPLSAPAETASGGALVLKVSTVLPGGVALSAERNGLRVLGTNPLRADVQAALQAAIVPSDASLTVWLQKIACHETSQRQFAAATKASQFRVEGEPLMNGVGDGGFGIMQISKPPSELPNAQRFELLWNWRMNVQKGVNVFKADKIPLAASYPATLRADPQVLATKTNTNADRASQSLPPLDTIVIRDFARSGPLGDELIEDAVRGYNGYAGFDQFGNRLHEFRLRTIGTGNNMIFDYTTPRMEGGLLVADAIWERVPAGDRGTYTSRNYVENVRAMNPTCP